MSPLRAVLVETLLVLALGLGLGLTANALRERGLDLGRDHFPTAPVAPAAVAGGGDAPAAGEGATEAASPDTGTAAGGAQAGLPTSSTNVADTAGAGVVEDPSAGAATDTAELPGDDAEPAAAGAELDPIIVERLARKGLRAASLSEARAFVEHEYYGYGLYMLLDARRPSDFAAGHIPGAKAWDPYAPELVSPELLGELQVAEKVFVYCNGGDCEDSETAALQLLGFGVLPDRLAVFAGGWTEWTEAGLPVEKGAP